MSHDGERREDPAGAEGHGRLPGLLGTVLGEESPVLDFAEAVITHLAGRDASAAERAKTTADVLEVLRFAAEGEEPLPTRELLARPAMLASFFQNADLLVAGSAEADRIARLVMDAVETGEGRLP